MPTPALFTPINIGEVELPNRLVVSPMCQYAANDGVASDWHLQHLMSLAMSGAGLVVVEATAVERAGRITHQCLGLYNDACEYGIARALAAAKSVALPGTRFGIQIAHAGRKASSKVPWEGGGPLPADPLSGYEPWQTFAPSAIPFDIGWQIPLVLDDAGMQRIEESFVATALRAHRLGFDIIELHLAHGYLLHEFASAISNHRDDAYGGARERRHAYPLRIATAVRNALPKHVPLGARITGTDWIEGGITVEDAADLAGELKGLGFSFVCVSSGSVAPGARIPVGPLYQTPLANEVRKKTGITTRAVGMIRTPREAEDVLTSGAADLVALARAFLTDPHWGWYAAEVLGFDLPKPPRYARSFSHNAIRDKM